MAEDKQTKKRSCVCVCVTLFSYLQEAGKLDYTPTQPFGFWLDQTHLVHIYGEESLGLATIFTDHHTCYEVTVI